MNRIDLAQRIGDFAGAAREIQIAGLDEADLPVAASGAEPRRDLAELEARLRDLTHFHDTVTHSLSWKVLQRLRGFVGRAW